MRGADLSSAKIYESELPGPAGAEVRSDFRGAVFAGSTKLPEEFANGSRINAVDLGMQFRVSANRADKLVDAGRNGKLPEITFEPGGTLVIPAETTLLGTLLGVTSITGSATLIIPSGGRLLQQGGAIHGNNGDGLWLLGRVEGQGPLHGRINVMDTLARNSRASFDDLWLAASATLELVAADWHSGPLFSGTKAWLDVVLSIDFAGANLLDGYRLVVIAAGTIGGSFDSTVWQNLPQGMELSLRLNHDGTQLALAVSVTAVPEPATPLLAALGVFLLWVRMRRGGGLGHGHHGERAMGGQRGDVQPRAWGDGEGRRVDASEADKDVPRAMQQVEAAANARQEAAGGARLQAAACQRLAACGRGIFEHGCRRWVAAVRDKRV